MKLLESLRGRKAFQAIRSVGNVFDGEILKVFYVIQPDAFTRLRTAVVVSKRHGAAVRRNRIKRRIRESFRAALGDQVKRLESMCVDVSAVVVYKGTKHPRPPKVSFEDIRSSVAKFVAVIQPPSVRK